MVLLQAPDVATRLRWGGIAVMLVLLACVAYWVAGRGKSLDAMHATASPTESGTFGMSTDLLEIDKGVERASAKGAKLDSDPAQELPPEPTGKPFWESNASIRITLIPGPDDAMETPPFVAMLFDSTSDHDFPEPVITSGLSQGNQVEMECSGGSYVLGILFPGSYMLQPMRQGNPLLMFVDGQSSTHLRLPVPELVTRKITLKALYSKDTVPGCDFFTAQAPAGSVEWGLGTDSEGAFEGRVLSERDLEDSRETKDSGMRWQAMRTLLKPAGSSVGAGFGLWDEKGATWLGAEEFLADILLGPLAGAPGRVSVQSVYLEQAMEGKHSYMWLGDAAWTSGLRCFVTDAYRIQTTFSSGAYSKLWAEVIPLDRGAVLNLGTGLQVLKVPSQIDDDAWKGANFWGTLELHWSCKRNGLAPRAFGGNLRWLPGAVLHLLSDEPRILKGVLSVAPQTRPGRLLVGEIQVNQETDINPLSVRMRHYEIQCVDAALKPVPNAGVAYTLFGRRNTAHAFADAEGLIRISLFGESALSIGPIGVHASNVINMGHRDQGIPVAGTAQPEEPGSSEQLVGVGRRVLFVPGFPTRVQVQVESEHSVQGAYVCIYREASERLPGRHIQHDVDYPFENGLLDSEGRTEFHGLPEGRYRIEVVETLFRGDLHWEPTYVDLSRQTPKPTVTIKLSQ